MNFESDHALVIFDLKVDESQVQLRSRERRFKLSNIDLSRYKDEVEKVIRKFNVRKKPDVDKKYIQITVGVHFIPVHFIPLYSIWLSTII